MGFHNIAGMKSATTGTGTLTLTTAVPGFNTFANAGILTGQLVKYTIVEGLNRECGYGIYTLSGLTLTRVAVESSTNGGSKISCLGTQFVFITPLASDMIQSYLPFAYPIGYVPSGTLASLAPLAANGGTYAAPVILSAQMYLQSVSIRNYDAATQRTWGWDLYYHPANDMSSQNTLTRVANSTANDTYSPGAASTRTVNAAVTPTMLSPGLYWIAIQNRHATSDFGLDGVTPNAFNAPNTGQTKTTTNPNGATLDFVTSWSKTLDARCIRLNGRVFGQVTAF